MPEASALDQVASSKGKVTFVLWNWFKKVREWILAEGNPSASKTANFTVDPQHLYYPCDATSGNITVTLPLVSVFAGKKYIFKKTDSSANTVIITPTSPDTIDGAASLTLSTQYESILTLADVNGNWPLVSHSGQAAAVTGQIPPGGRLTLTSGTPVTSADVATSSNVYYTPYIDDQITLWTGSAWSMVTFTEQTMALSSLTSGLPYDVFGFLSAGALAIEKLAWTSNTARATAITLQGGRYCKSGDKTRLYLGTFYTISTSATADAVAQRFLWNNYNRVDRHLIVTEATDTWSYTTGQYRQVRASTSNKFECITGLAEDVFHAEAYSNAALQSNATTFAAAGIGLNSTTVNSATIINPVCNNDTTATLYLPMSSILNYIPAVGYMIYKWLELGASSTCSFSGTNGFILSGMTANFRM